MKLDFSKQLGGVTVKISAFVVGIVTLFFVVNTIISTSMTYDKTLKNTCDIVDITMQSSMNDLTSRFKSVQLITETMALNTEQIATDTTVCRNFMKKIMKANPDISTVSIMFAPYYVFEQVYEYAPVLCVRPSGDTIYADVAEMGYHYVDAASDDENWQQGVKGQCVWSKPYFNLGDDQARVAYSVPMYNNKGEMFAVVCSSFTLDWIKRNFERIRQNTECELCIISRKGNFIVNLTQNEESKDNALELAKSRNDTEMVEVIEKMMRGESGYAVIHSPYKKYVQFLPIEYTNWSVYYTCPLETMQQESNELVTDILTRGVITMLLLFFIATIGVYVIIHPFTVNLKKVTESNAALNHDLKLASIIQQSMLPQDEQETCGLGQVKLAGMLRPAKMVGGDLYGYFCKKNILYFCIGDISGKGVPAAMYMVIIRILIDEISNTETEVDKIIEKLNKTMTRSDNSMFCTLFLGALDLATGKISCCNAGHNPPILVAHDEEGNVNVEYLKIEPNAAVGIFSDEEYSSEEIVLRPHDSLFLYTDGVTEAEDIQHRLFGEDNTLKVIKNLPDGVRSEEVIRTMLKAVDNHAGHAVQSDDITMLLIHYTPKDTLTLVNDVSQTTLLGEWVALMCKRHDLSQERLFNIQLAVEEAVVNVMNYSYPGKKDMPIYLSMEAQGNYVTFKIEDEGIPYNPLDTPVPDIEEPTEDCKVGGLGIFLYKMLFDEIGYSYENGRNVLRMRIIKEDNQI